MKISCMILDDEVLARRLLADYISKVPSLELVANCTNAIEASMILKRQPVDLLFLDIQMPDITGLHFLQSLGKKQLAIFTTAYTEYAVQSYELNALDYLVKPIAFERFFQAVGKAQDFLERAGAAKEDVENDEPYLFLKSDQRIYRVAFDDIDYIEAYGEYVRVYRGAEQIMPLMSIGKLEEILPSDRFVRVHRSFLVQFRKIDSIYGNTIKIGDREIAIGKTYRDALIERINRRHVF